MNKFWWCIKIFTYILYLCKDISFSVFLKAKISAFLFRLFFLSAAIKDINSGSGLWSEFELSNFAIVEIISSNNIFVTEIFGLIWLYTQ